MSKAPIMTFKLTGSFNKKKERKKNETIETAVIRFGNGSNDRGDVDDGICTGKCIGGRR